MNCDGQRTLQRLHEELRRPLTGWEWLLEAVALGGLATALGIVAASWRTLPARIPTHFLFTGRDPDYRGDPLELLFFLGIQVAVYALLTGSLRLPPELLNHPHPMTEEAIPRWAAAIRFVLRGTKAFLMCLQAHQVWLATAVARGHAVGSGRWVEPSLVALPVLLITVMWLAARPHRRLR